MSLKQILLFSSIFAFFITSANYLVTISINNWVNYGMLMYPLTFLFTDILSEKYIKKEVIKIVFFGSLLAIIPTILIAGWLIAIASITTFIVIQQLDVQIFHFLKEKFYSKWWLRNNLSTIFSQLFDTIAFYILAFWALPSIALIVFGQGEQYFIMQGEQIIRYIIIDYSIKVIFALCDTPIFYALVIKQKKYFQK